MRIDHSPGGGDVIGQRGQGILHSCNSVAVLFEQRYDLLPAGTVGERPVNKHDRRFVVLPNLGSLERLERITFSSVTLGFALLSVGLVTGLIGQLRMERITRLGDLWWASPKVVLSTSVLVVYSVVLHSRINPVLRGRKVAILSIVGCLLMVGALIALNLMPSGGAAGGSR